MKNSIKLIAIVFCTSIIFVSCSKDETSNVTGKSQQTTQSFSVTDQQSTSELKSATFGRNFIFDPENKKCLPIPLDCYDDVVVRPTQVTAMKHFENAVLGNAGDVQYFFTYDAWFVLFPELDGTADLDSLRSGHYDMVMTSDEDKIFYYGAGNQYPLNFQNEKFVLRLNKSGLK
jgi:hypothetical protein